MMPHNYKVFSTRFSEVILYEPFSHCLERTFFYTYYWFLTMEQLPGDSDCKESACNVGDLGLSPGLGRSPGGGHDNSIEHSCLENPHG